MAHFIAVIWLHVSFLSRRETGSHLCSLDGILASREADETFIKVIEVRAQYLRCVARGIGGDKNHLELAGHSRWQFPQRTRNHVHLHWTHVRTMGVPEKEKCHISLGLGLKIERRTRGIRERKFWFGERRRNQPSVIVGFAGRGTRWLAHIRGRLCR